MSHAEMSLKSFLMNLSFTTYSNCCHEATEELLPLIMYLVNAIKKSSNSSTFV